MKIYSKQTSHATTIYHIMKTRVTLNLRTLRISPKAKQRKLSVKSDLDGSIVVPSTWLEVAKDFSLEMCNRWALSGGEDFNTSIGIAECKAFNKKFVNNLTRILPRISACLFKTPARFTRLIDLAFQSFSLFSPVPCPCTHKFVYVPGEIIASNILLKCYCTLKTVTKHRIFCVCTMQQAEGEWQEFLRNCFIHVIFTHSHYPLWLLLLRRHLKH